MRLVDARARLHLAVLVSTAVISARSRADKLARADSNLAFRSKYKAARPGSLRGQATETVAGLSLEPVNAGLECLSRTANRALGW